MKYFVSFVYTIDDSLGHGNAFFDTEHKIECKEHVRDLENRLSLVQQYENAIVMNFQIIKEDDNE